MTRRQELDFSVDVLRALLWQYNDAENLQALLQSKQDWYTENQSEFWTNWIVDVFDLRTANNFGLTVWSIILGVPLSITLAPDYLDKQVFGFAPFGMNFDNGNFGSKSSSDITLSLEQKRLVLRLRYYQLVSRGTIPQTNQFLASLFADEGSVYALDLLDMRIVYVFNFSLPSSLQFVLDNYDILPRPAGVGTEYRVTTRLNFGFGPYYQNYDNGNFGA